jgi:3-phosphoinositide dependent protein kinase-1
VAGAVNDAELARQRAEQQEEELRRQDEAQQKARRRDRWRQQHLSFRIQSMTAMNESSDDLLQRAALAVDAKSKDEELRRMKDELRQRQQEMEALSAADEATRAKQREADNQKRQLEQEKKKQMDEERNKKQLELEKQRELERKKESTEKQKEQVVAVAAAVTSTTTTTPPTPITTPPATPPSSIIPSDAKKVPEKLYVKDFLFGAVLGKGAFGEVKLVTEKSTGVKWACKILDKKFIQKEKKVNYVMNERNILQELKGHPNIVHLYATFQDDNNLCKRREKSKKKKLILSILSLSDYVLELCTNGELLQLIKDKRRLDVSTTGFYVGEIINAVKFMHSKGIIHRDLKPENVLLDPKMHVKLTDFGTAKNIGNERKSKRTPERMSRVFCYSILLLLGRSNSFAGTAEYVSPEMLGGDKCAGKASDIWALGCIVYQMLSGKVPFHGENDFLTFQQILARQIKFPPFLSADSLSLINALLVSVSFLFALSSRSSFHLLIQQDPDSDKRYDFFQTISADPFFRGVDFAKLLDLPAPTPVVLSPWVESDTAASSTSSVSATPVISPSPTTTTPIPQVDNSLSSSKTAVPFTSIASPAVMSSLAAGSVPSPTKSLIRSPSSPLLQAADSVDWSRLMQPDESVQRAAAVFKRGTFSKKPCYLLLTSKQRMLVVKSDKITVKLTVQMSADTRVLYKDESHMSITPPKGKTLSFEDPQRQAASWVDMLTDSAGPGGTKVIGDKRKTVDRQ